MKNWNEKNIPNQSGRVIIITGATSGLGKEATRVLAEKNATVIMAVRNTPKAESVAKKIRDDYPNAKIAIRKLDLSSLASIDAFCTGILSRYKNLDVLINNAGVMMCPYSKSVDGFEIQMATNHLGHFALTGLLMPLLKRTEGSRVVATSSVAHKSGDINFEDFNWEFRNYKTTQAYGDSKLANLYFVYELARKFDGIEQSPMFLAAHPGWTKTELDRHSGLFKFLGNVLAQKVEMGTLPTLRAATDMSLKSGDYLGPKMLFEIRGYPVIVKSNAMSHRAENARKLWNLSEKLTGVVY